MNSDETMSNFSYPQFPLTFEYERNFDVEETKKWIDRNSHLSLCYTLVYLSLTYLAVRYMKNRQPVTFKWSLFAWNMSLALMSILGASRTVTELSFILRHYGFEFSVCNSKYSEGMPVLVSAVYIFCMSKVVELFDTMFIVMGKKKLIFLHWFHHSSVMIFSWYTTADRVAMGRWFSSMNFTVHSFMYTYFAISALRIRVPKPCKIVLTMMQIVQMLAGFFVNIVVLSKWLKGEQCSVSGRVVFLGMSLYSLYFGLFVNFFVENYLFARKIKQRKD